MYLQHLSLKNFRNYLRLELPLPPGVTVVQGGNGQGKTNLLESVVFLATSKSLRATHDRELVNWLAFEREPIPFAEVAGEVQQDGRVTSVRIVLAQQKGRDPQGGFQKAITIDGVQRRALELLGLLPVVVFMPEDLLLISGPPSLRRRYLNLLLCQVDREYCQHLDAFNKVVARRNAQLREFQGQPVNSDLMAFWDERFIRHAAFIMHRRQALISRLDVLARGHHAALAAQQGRLRLVYRPALSPASAAERLQRPLPMPQEPVAYGEEPVPPIQTWAKRLQRALAETREEEAQRGMTLVGPHRDELVFFMDGRDIRVYGSRGQQRTVALALKFAEVELITEALGTSPILLLDDVMSELDAQRRERVIQLVQQVPQAIITTTDWSDFTPDFLRQVHRLHVEAGLISPVETSP